MGREVKISKERCKQCKYGMKMTGASMGKGPDSYSVIACGYILKTGQSRVFEKGKKKDDYKPGYCKCYEKGPRIESLDSLTRNNTLKKGNKKRA